MCGWPIGPTRCVWIPKVRMRASCAPWGQRFISVGGPGKVFLLGGGGFLAIHPPQLTLTQTQENFSASTRLGPAKSLQNLAKRNVPEDCTAQRGARCDHAIPKARKPYGTLGNEGFCARGAPKIDRACPKCRKPS